jgi:hypothetical protein
MVRRPLAFPQREKKSARKPTEEKRRTVAMSHARTTSYSATNPVNCRSVAPPSPERHGLHPHAGLRRPPLWIGSAKAAPPMRTFSRTQWQSTSFDDRSHAQRHRPPTILNSCRLHHPPAMPRRLSAPLPRAPSPTQLCSMASPPVFQRRPLFPCHATSPPAPHQRPPHGLRDYGFPREPLPR